MPPKVSGRDWIVFQVSAMLIAIAAMQSPDTVVYASTTAPATTAAGTSAPLSTTAASNNTGTNVTNYDSGSLSNYTQVCFQVNASDTCQQWAISCSDNATASNNVTNSNTTIVNNVVVIVQNTTIVENSTVQEQVDALTRELDNLRVFFRSDLGNIEGVSRGAAYMLWTCFFVFIAIFMFLTWIRRSPVRTKSSNRVALLGLVLGSVSMGMAYLSMANGQGRLLEPAVSFEQDNQNLSAAISYSPSDPNVWYVRRIALLVATSSHVLVLWLLSNAPNDALGLSLGCNCLMHGCFLVATLIPSTQPSKWLFWLFGLLFLFVLTYSVFKLMRAAATAQSVQSKGLAHGTSNVSSSDVFNRAMWVSFPFWLTYAMLWIFFEGSRSADGNTELLVYGAMDILSNIAISALYLYACCLNLMQERLETLRSLILRRKSSGSDSKPISQEPASRSESSGSSSVQPPGPSSSTKTKLKNILTGRKQSISQGANPAPENEMGQSVPASSAGQTPVLPAPPSAFNETQPTPRRARSNGSSARM